MNGFRWVAVAAVLAVGVNAPAVVATPPTTPPTSTAAAQSVVSLTGVAVPTNDVVVAPGTLMSTYGHLRLYDGTGKATPLVNRFVYVETRPLSNPAAPYEAISTGKTTATGYYYANWRARADVDVRVSVTGTPAKTTYLGQLRPRPRPTWLDGVARPTAPTTMIRIDTRMSAFGHLRVLYGTGKVGPYAGQRVKVQLVEAVEPEPSGPAYTTVGTATTTSTGYFFTNWSPGAEYFRNTDVSVRLVFSEAYTTVTPSVLELGVIHVQ